VLTINVADSDDLDPSFIYRGCVNLDGACLNPEYTATVPAGQLQGVLNIHPERIQAVDLDQISAPIKYSFIGGAPSTYREYFEIDEQTGIVKQKKLVDSSVTARQFDITIQAEEATELKRSTTARLTVNVKPVDSFPPVIQASAAEGFVDENSPKGTKVLDSKGNAIKLMTTDADIPEDGQQLMYTYELTTPSFAISSDGILLVNEAGLDRDAPNLSKLRFQVVAREVKGNAASSPLSITVNLNDINDNSPKLALIPPVQITAGNEKRLIAKANATDNDSGENAVISYSIHHVSNNGMKKFTIDRKSGEIEAVARLVAGERYSITVQASDIGNLYSQAIVEVTVIPGPNTKPPKFVKSVYDVQVSEGADINSTVAVVKAEDPESDPVHYTIVSGNDLRQFSIGTESGVITVLRKLDREQITRYQLIVKADDNGGLSSSATVNVRVTDINDNNPVFDESMMPFKFEVEEGKKNASVGKVHATDIDEGANAEISYSLSDEIPFVIGLKSGEIRTKVALDYEKQKEYKFVVTAKDGSQDMRLGTATVTVNVKDIPDELPKFTEAVVEVKVPENVPDLAVATVTAKDPDTKPEITYVFKNGPSELFKIDPKTGVIRTVKGLDYEEEKKIEVVVGTAENSGRGPGDTIKVRINVEDRNDVPPVFISIPEPVTVNDDLPIGSKVGSMPAIDGDGTAPSNTVRYEMVGRGKALKYFQVDPDTGDVLLRDELKKEEDTEYQIDVRAFDLGEPQLSSVASLPVYVKHVLSDPINDHDTEPRTDTSPIMNPESIGLAFSDDVYTVSVPETTGINATLKLLQIINSKKSTKNRGGFKCEITNGNDWNLFKTIIEDHSCGIVLINHLDFENKSSHDIGIKLTSTKYLVNPQKSFSLVKVIVQDQNDNAPAFRIPSGNKNGRNDTFYGTVSSEADIDTPVMTIKATDADSGVFGMLKYRIYDDDEFNYISKDETPSSFFTIAEDTGMLKTQKSLGNRRIQQPFKFIVEVRAIFAFCCCSFFIVIGRGLLTCFSAFSGWFLD
jgi:protocadherin-15